MKIFEQNNPWFHDILNFFEKIELNFIYFSLKLAQFKYIITGTIRTLQLLFNSFRQIINHANNMNLMNTFIYAYFLFILNNAITKFAFYNLIFYNRFAWFPEIILIYNNRYFKNTLLEFKGSWFSLFIAKLVVKY